MPSIKDKLKAEERNSQTVRLWPEGMFYKAYERSAYLFVTQVKAYEVRRQFVKSAGQDVLSIGFPQSVLNTLDVKFDRSADGTVLLRVSTVMDDQQYMLWREAQAGDLTPTLPREGAGQGSAAAAVVERIRKFSLADSTPMQCMLLLSELQQALNHDDAGPV